MNPQRSPHYDLAKVRAAIWDGHYFITGRARRDAAEIVMDEDDIRECVLGLGREHFYKSMPSRKLEGLFHTYTSAAISVLRCT